MTEVQAIKALSRMQANMTRAIIEAIAYFSPKKEYNYNHENVIRKIMFENCIDSEGISKEWEFQEERSKEEAKNGANEKR